MNQNRMAVATPQPAAPMAGSPNLPNTKMMLSGTLSASPTNPATMAGRVLPWPSRKQRCTTKNMSAGTPPEHGEEVFRRFLCKLRVHGSPLDDGAADDKEHGHEQHGNACGKPQALTQKMPALDPVARAERLRHEGRDGHEKSLPEHGSGNPERRGPRRRPPYRRCLRARRPRCPRRTWQSALSARERRERRERPGCGLPVC